MLAGCAPPIGTLNGGNGYGIDMDAMWIIPNRLLYELENDFFDREYDLRIFLAENGTVKEIDPSDDDVTIEVFEYDSFLGGRKNPRTVILRYIGFEAPGRNDIEVTYKGKSAHYSVEVRGVPLNREDGSEFLDIIWL
jgi:hypothetical protein